MNIRNISTPFTSIFPGDRTGNTRQRQTPGVLYCTVRPEHFPNPKLILFNEKLSQEIGLGPLENDADFLAARNLPENIQPYATAYAGHQFGGWSPQLGDGRAICIGEISDQAKKKTELQWKGAGATPYSRFADGRAVLRSSLREYLMSEAMHHLRIKTTRALSLCTTGEEVVRDIMYNGNAAPEQGAVIVRTAESFLRFGHFEFLSAQKNIQLLQRLADFTIKNYFTEITADGTQKYIDFFRNIAHRTADLMVDWYRVGFVHGVMNTDNMSALGLTIDYGPFSFLDEYDLNFTPNTTDLPGRRYAFGGQAKIAQWNLWQLANALFPLIGDEKVLEEILEEFGEYFWNRHDEMLSKKFGFGELLPTDRHFFTDWQNLMQSTNVDYTLFFNKLEKITANVDADLAETFYGNTSAEDLRQFDEFISKYRSRLEISSANTEQSQKLMRENNPKFILRNYLLYNCIEEVSAGKNDLLNKLLRALENPYEDIFPEFSAKRPSKFNGVVGCSTLSCSS